MTPPILDVAVIGTPRSGKTSLIETFCQPSSCTPVESYPTRKRHTVNVLLKNKVFELRFTEPQMCNDDVGNDLHRWANIVIARTHRLTRTFILVHDLSNPVSFFYIQFLKGIIVDMAQAHGFEVMILLLGNKADLLPLKTQLMLARQLKKEAKLCVRLRDRSCGASQTQEPCRSTRASIMSHFSKSLDWGNKFYKVVQEIVSAKFNWRVFMVFQKATEFAASHLHIVSIKYSSRPEIDVDLAKTARSCEKGRNQSESLSQRLTVPRTPSTDLLRRNMKRSSVRFLQRRLSLTVTN